MVVVEGCATQDSETLIGFLTGPGMAGGLQLAQGRGPWGSGGHVDGGNGEVGGSGRDGGRTKMGWDMGGRGTRGMAI